MPLPAWEKMTDQEKFDFLEKWCQNLTTATQQSRAEIQQLHERVRQVESKADSGNA